MSERASKDVQRSARLVVGASVLFVASLAVVPIGVLAFAYEDDLTPPGHGAAGWCIRALTIIFPATAATAVELAVRRKNGIAKIVLCAALAAGIALAVLARLIAHYGIR